MVRRTNSFNVRVKIGRWASAPTPRLILYSDHDSNYEDDDMELPQRVKIGRWAGASSTWLQKHIAWSGRGVEEWGGGGPYILIEP